MLLETIELGFRFILPPIIFSCLIIGYYFYEDFFKKCSLDKPILSLLILGAGFYSLVNIPILITDDLILAINFGSVIIPIIISLYFISKLRNNLIILLLLLVVIIIISFITFTFSYIDPEIGIVIDFPYYLLPIILSVIFAILIPKKKSYYVVPISYSICTFGVVIGTDLVRLPVFKNHFKMGFIGGLGILDYLYISGLFAIAFSLLFTIISNRSALINKTREIKRKSAHRVLFITQNIHLALDEVDKKRLAGINSRIIAFIIDLAIQVILFSILFMMVFKDFSFDFNYIFTRLNWLIFITWAWTIHILYFTLFELIFSQTIGKMFVGIKVIPERPIFNNKKTRKIYGQKKLIKILTRNLLRIIDFALGLYLLSLVMIILTNHRQRIGDFLADTYVINL